jgi:hypothetical protein
MRRFSLLIFCLFLLTACGDRQKLETDFDGLTEEELNVEPHTYFKLFNSSGASEPEYVPETGKAPFGAMMAYIRLPESNLVRPVRCSVAHIAPGLVLTASHCASIFVNDPKQVWVVYYDKQHALHSKRARDIQVVASQTQRDIAFLKFEETELDWDSWSASYAQFVESSTLLGADKFAATIWGLDPIPVPRADRGKARLAFAMRVAPRHCIGSKAFPVLKAKPQESSKPAVASLPLSSVDGEGNLIQTKDLERSNFYYFDECKSYSNDSDQNWVFGNSGGLITADGALPAPAAVASAIYFMETESSQSIDENLDYTGPSGTRTISRKDYLAKPLFALGAIFDPNLIKPLPTPFATAPRFDVP